MVDIDSNLFHIYNVTISASVTNIFSNSLIFYYFHSYYLWMSSCTRQNFAKMILHWQQHQQKIKEPPIFEYTQTQYCPLGPQKPVWKYFQNLEFYGQNKFSWRVCICTIEDRCFACVSHWCWSNLLAVRQFHIENSTYLRKFS